MSNAPQETLQEALQKTPAVAPEQENSWMRKATLLCLGSLTVMSGATIAPSLPALQIHFADSANGELFTRLVLTLPALFIALCAPVAGNIADRFGRRRLLLLSTLLYGLAGSSALLLDSLPGILLGRALLGIAVAGTMTSVTALVGDYFSGPARDRFMGLQAAFFSFGGVVFLTVGGLLADWHWRAPFAVYAVALLLIPAALLHLAEPARPGKTSASADIHFSARGRFALTALFAVALFNSLAFYMVPTQLPFLLQQFGNLLPSHTGLAIGGGNLMGALVSLLFYRRLRERLGIVGVFVFSFAFMAAGFTLIAGAGSYLEIVCAMAVFGVGMGAMMPHLGATAMNLAPPSARGRVAGGLTASIFLGQFLSPLVSQPWSASFGLSASFAHMGILLLLLATLAVAAAQWPQQRLA